MLNLPHFSLVITTLMLLFQKLNEKEMIMNAPVRASFEDLPEVIVDLEVARIASENVTTSYDLGATETVLRETSDDAD
jgi:hypothetical protein